MQEQVEGFVAGLLAAVEAGRQRRARVGGELDSLRTRSRRARELAAEIGALADRDS